MQVSALLDKAVEAGEKSDHFDLVYLSQKEAPQIRSRGPTDRSC